MARAAELFNASSSPSSLGLGGNQHHRRPVGREPDSQAPGQKGFVGSGSQHAQRPRAVWLDEHRIVPLLTHDIALLDIVFVVYRVVGNNARAGSPVPICLCGANDHILDNLR
jgi:hypothetical protein